MEMGSDRDDSALDAVIRDAVEQNQKQQQQQQQDSSSEFDAIARYRGQAQEQMSNLLLGHLQGDGGGHKQEGLEAKVPESQSSGEAAAAEKLHKSSEDAKKRVIEADRTYDAINEAKKVIGMKLEEHQE